MSKREEFSDLIRDYNTRAPILLKESLLELIEENGWEGVEIVGWTPYFNDGDACNFGVYQCRPLLFKEESEEEWNSDIAQIVCNDEDLLYQLFGHEGKMRLYKDGSTEVQDINHD